MLAASFQRLSLGSTLRRAISATSWHAMPLDEFRDPTPRDQRMNELVGRSWSARELRRKSFDDLHKLWLVLYKEKNMLLTEQQLCRRKDLRFPQPERFQKVRKSMGAIRHVLGERKRERIKALLTKREAEQEAHKKAAAELEAARKAEKEAKIQKFYEKKAAEEKKKKAEEAAAAKAEREARKLAEEQAAADAVAKAQAELAESDDESAESAEGDTAEVDAEPSETTDEDEATESSHIASPDSTQTETTPEKPPET